MSEDLVPTIVSMLKAEWDLLVFSPKPKIEPKDKEHTISDYEIPLILVSQGAVVPQKVFTNGSGEIDITPISLEIYGKLRADCFSMAINCRTIANSKSVSSGFMRWIGSLEPSDVGGFYKLVGGIEQKQIVITN
jgi:hypothetical protein